MLFDVDAALAEVLSDRPRPAISAIPAIQPPSNSGNSKNSGLPLGELKSADAGREVASRLRPCPSGRDRPKARPLHTVEDAAAYAGFLRLHGPQTYGAVAASLGWGASRAWRAEAELRARGRLAFGHAGRASLKEGETS